MRKLIVSMNITLNGFMAGPRGELDWHMPFWDDEMSRVAALQLGNADTLLLGRVTYQGMAAYWGAYQGNFSARADADFADMMTRHEKVVFSRSLTRLTGWRNSRLATCSVVKEVDNLKQSAGKDLLVYGSGRLTDALMRHNLIDEYRLWVYPIALSKGRSLFKGLRKRLTLNPVQTQVFGNGAVLLCYSPYK